MAWRQLLTALGAAPLIEADATPTPAHWALIHPYPMPPHFTGRTAERQQLRTWLEADDAEALLAALA